MARIFRRVVRISYYSKSSYEYETRWLYLPKRFHDILKPYVNQDLDIHVQQRNGKIHIVLAPKQSKP